MKISLLDPGLSEMKGHHFDWIYQLAREASRRGMDVTVGCALGGAEDMLHALRPFADVRPVFSVSPYQAEQSWESFRATEASKFLRHTSFSRILARELRCLPVTDFWLFPTLFAEQAAACVLVETRPAMGGCIHDVPRPSALAAGHCWQPALDALALSEKAARIGTTTTPLQRTFGQLSAMPVDVWPLAHDGMASSRPRQAMATVGILGYQRPEKNVGLLPGLIDRLLHSGLQVLLHDSSNQVRPSPRPGLTLISGFVADFASMLQRCDLIIVPNDPASYRQRGSGIVWEALACGVPVLAPSGCCPGEIVEQSGAGLCFAEPTAESVWNAVAQAAADYPRLAAAAHECSSRWLEQHGVGRFLDRALRPD